MVLADISEVDLMSDRTSDGDSPKVILAIVVAAALQVDTDMIDVVDFEPLEDQRVLAQVVCDQRFPDNVRELEVNLRSGNVFDNND